MLHHFNNHQHVSIAFAIIIGAALQQYKEYTWNIRNHSML